MTRNFRRRDSRSTFRFRSLTFKSQVSGGYPSVVPLDPVAIDIFSPLPINMASGQTYQLLVRLVDGNGDSVLTGQRNILFSSSNNNVASITTVAVITAVSAGTCGITITDVPDSLTTTAIAIVTSPQAAPSSISVLPNPLPLTSGATTTVVAYVLDSNGTFLTGQTGTWSSSSTYVSTVSDIGGDPAHQAIVTATSASTATCTISFTV